jgi:ATP-dependent DNA helicase RecG
MVRVDYIRVPGNIWIEDPDNRFTTVDMRGSLLEMVQRAFSLVSDDLPNGFLLPDGELQAESIGLPARVLREALVNSMIHRTFRVNQPIQIIRYGNRIEISNPGFSLKPEEHLGIPGSVTRNSIIATIFHETNLAETKGSGIRTMRSLMEKAQMLPPTFESSHDKNQFTIRLLLHHFLGEEDLNWLAKFNAFNLNEAQKCALIFIREVGAIDNPTYQQLNGAEMVKIRTDLHDLKEKKILTQKGKGKAIYYVPGEELIKLLPVVEENEHGNEVSVQDKDNSEHGNGVSVQGKNDSEQGGRSNDIVRIELVNQLPPELASALPNFTGRVNNKADLADFICRLCAVNSYSLSQLSLLLNKRERYLLTKFVKPMRENGRLSFTIPEMQKHPKQAYRTINK